MKNTHTAKKITATQSTQTLHWNGTHLSGRSVNQQLQRFTPKRCHRQAAWKRLKIEMSGFFLQGVPFASGASHLPLLGVVPSYTNIQLLTHKQSRCTTTTSTSPSGSTRSVKSAASEHKVTCGYPIFDIVSRIFHENDQNQHFKEMFQ